MNRKRIHSNVLRPDDMRPVELVYVTSQAEASEIFAERARFQRVIADQGVWLVGFLAVAGGFIEFSPDEMVAAGERLSEGPIHVARSREGAVRISLEPFGGPDVVGDRPAAGNGVDHRDGDDGDRPSEEVPGEAGTGDVRPEHDDAEVGATPIEPEGAAGGEDAGEAHETPVEEPA